MFKGYQVIDHLIDGVSNYLSDKGFDSVRDIIGHVLPKLTSIEKLDFRYQVIPRIDRSTCTKCGSCLVACRDAGYEAIKLDDETLPIFNMKRCDSCGLCSQVCSVEAISLGSRQ